MDTWLSTIFIFFMPIITAGQKAAQDDGAAAFIVLSVSGHKSI
jgi:hypothetical protein